MKENLILSEKIKKIIEEIRPQPVEISFAVINLKTKEPEIAGYNMDHYIYPASIYKVFIGAEVLRQVFEKRHSLDEVVKIESPNDVDKDFKLFPRSSRRDHRPLLKAGESVTIDYLLDLVFTRSDNTAANTLLDLVGRENINQHIIIPNGWEGSGITRKFLDRSKEDEKYRYSETTVSCARHLAELFYKIETKQLINEWVSVTLKEYLKKWDHGGRTGLYIPEFENDGGGYYRKGGWLEVNGYKIDFWKVIKNVREKGHAINRWINDAGVVTGKNSHYAIAILTLTKSKWPWVKFPMKKFSREVWRVMESV